MPGTVRLVDPDGGLRDVPVEAAGTLLQDSRWRIATTADALDRAVAQARETDYGGVGGAVAATGAAVARGATLGASDAAARLIGGEDARFDLSQLRAENPGISTGGEIAGVIAPALLTGGASLPAGLAGAAGRSAAAAVGGGIRGAIAGEAITGGLLGLGQGVSELALSDDPLTLSHAAATLSSNALYGAAAGAGAGLAAKGVEAGLGAAKRALDRALVASSEQRAMRAVGELETEAAAHPSAIGPETDVTTLDRAGLKKAREQAVEEFHAAQEPERRAFVDDLRASRDAAEAEKTWIATQGGKTREVRSLGRATLEADKRIDALLKVEADLVDKPQRALSALRQQEQALTKLQEWGERETGRYLDEVATGRDRIRAELLDNKIDGFRFGKGGISRTSPVVNDIVERLFQERYPTPDRLPTNLQVLNAVPGAIERNRALQDRLARLAEAPASPRLSAIDEAEAKLGIKAPVKEPESALGAVGAVLKAAAHAVPFGSVAEKAAGALGGIRKAIGAGAERTARAASAFLGKAEPAVAKAAKVTPRVTATAALASLRYGEPETDARGKRVAKPEPKTLPELYRARTDEIRSQVQLAPDGSFQMRPAARVKMAAKLSGLGVVDPIAADRLESAGAARIAWLASQMPRRPDFAGLPVGPDTWRPSDLEMRAWAIKAAAADDPYAVLARASAGKKARVVPEEAMALQALYAPLLDDYVTRIVTGLSDRKERLPYPQRLALSMLTGRPLDPAMTPNVMRELQSMFAAEPGTAGGTMAPRPSPQFGSVKRSDTGTPAQRRQGVGL